MSNAVHEQATDLPGAPVLTLPPEEAKVLRSAYATANVILEYGSGGSTAIAAAMPDKTIFSVENDIGWSKNLQKWFTDFPPAANVNIHTVNIGPTREWGLPADESGWRKYYHYPTSVWDRPDFKHPDLILIDGRFRAACFVTAALRITEPVTVLWDDYLTRRAYHEVERYIPKTSLHGRMARFDLTPGTLSLDNLTWILKQYGRHL